MFKPHGAAKLPNGAEILSRRLIGSTWVWLCNYGGVEPFVTWLSNECSPGDTYWGNYFSDETKARVNFQERIRECAGL